jgi:RNA polymerase sigma-70 factor (ECF subfamily)
MPNPAGPPEPATYRPGDRDDFDRLYRTCYPRLLRTIYAVVGSAAAAEDCVQDAFVRGFRAWPRFRPDGSAEGWIYQIAMNVAISYRRRDKLRQVGEVIRRLGRPVAERDPSEAATQPDIVAAIASLPPRVAAAFVLRHYHGYNNREIASMEGVSERMIGIRLAQARDRLAHQLGAEWRGELPTSAPQGVQEL